MNTHKAYFERKCSLPHKYRGFTLLELQFETTSMKVMPFFSFWISNALRMAFLVLRTWFGV